MSKCTGDVQTLNFITFEGTFYVVVTAGAVVEHCAVVAE